MTYNNAREKYDQGKLKTDKNWEMCRRAYFHSIINTINIYLQSSYKIIEKLVHEVGEIT